MRHGKSWYASWLFPAWYLLTHPHHSVMVVSYGSEFTETWSGRIRDTINEWGHLTGVRLDPNYSARSYFKLAPPYTGELFGSGIQGGLGGRGCHLAIVDDLIKKQMECATEELRNKMWTAFHADLLNRLEPDANIFLIGSRRHPDDIPGRLFEQNQLLSPEQQWHRIRMPAIGDDGAALWPERYSLKQLENLRRDYELAGESHLWDTLHMQDPATAATDCEWPASYWDDLFYTELPKFNPVFRLGSLDPSVGKNKKRGDFAALFFSLIDPEGTLWLDDVSMLRIPITELRDLTIGKLKQLRPQAFAVECNNFQSVIADNILEHYPPAPIWRYHNTRNIAKAAGYSANLKQVEIRLVLSPFLRAKRLKIRDTPAGRIVAQQLRDFPEGSHDDGPDALVQMLRLWQDLLHGSIATEEPVTSSPA